MAIRYFTKKDGAGIYVSNASTVPKKGTKDQHAAGDIFVISPQETPNFMGQHQAVAEHFAESNPGQEHPTELFSHSPPYVFSAYVDPSIRHTMPTMVALAVNKMGAAHDTIMSADSLTAYSSRLSRAANSRGMSVPDPQNATMSANSTAQDLPYADMPERTIGPLWLAEGMPRNMEEATPDEVAQARQSVKDRLRKSKRTPQVKRGASQFEQLSLEI